MDESLPPNLPVLAEIAIAMVGFLAIVAALRARQGQTASDRVRIHTTVLLTASVIVLGMALLPSWLAALPGVQERVLTTSLRILLAVHLLAWFVFLPLLRRGQALRGFPRAERVALVFVSALGVVAVAAEVWVVAGGWPAGRAFVYEGVLLFFLGVGVFNFFALILGPRD